MSTSNQKKRSVRFTEESIAHGNERVAVAQQQRRRPADDKDDDDPPRKRQKRPRQDRPNEDELDDLDDFVAGADDDDERDIPSETQTLRAKRERRLKQAHDDDDDGGGTKIDMDTSLASEGIAIEPFHMNEENTDGTGYFDGDTYVFRRGDGGEEPDAWLESIEEKGDELVESSAAKARARSGTRLDDDDDDDEGNANSGNKMDSWTDQELYAQIIPLVSDSETVMRAIARYGNLLKRKKDETDTDLAKKALNDLTEAASALLLKGQHDIYQKTRNELSELLSDKPKGATDGEALSSPVKPVVHWEYQGSQDNQVHGPFTTQQMQGWIQQGYFVGPSAVMLRSIREEATDQGKSQSDDLLSDLLEDDDEDAEAKQPSSKIVKGEWTKSDLVDFSTYA